MRGSWWVGPLVVATLLVAVPAAMAHNPATTVYEPTPFQGDLLVLGEEGTTARVTLDGIAAWQTDLEAQILQPAVVHGDAAATVLRIVPEGAPVVQGLDADGASWTVPLTDGREVGFVVSTDEGFLALASDGTILHLAPDGTEQARSQLEIHARTAPVPAPGGGWVVAGEDGRLAIVDETGEVQADTRLGGPPTDLARHGDLILAALRRADVASVKALDAELATRWIVDRDALRIGGQLAVGDDAIYLGTFRPAGAHAVAVSPNGSILWEQRFANDTAAAASVDGERVYVTLNSGVQALDRDGEVLWSASLQPRITGPSIVEDLVLPSGAENRLVALHASDGTVAWTWTDGVDTVPWTDEQLAREGAGNGAADQDGGANESPVGAAWLLVAVLAAFVADRVRPPH